MKNTEALNLDAFRRCGVFDDREVHSDYALVKISSEESLDLSIVH